jgi:hypothetical protein
MRRLLTFTKEPGQLSRYTDGLPAGQPGFESQQGQDISLLHSIQTGSGAHLNLLSNG